MSTPEKSVTIHVAVPKRVVAALDRAAEAHGLTRGAYVRMLLTKATAETKT